MGEGVGGALREVLAAFDISVSSEELEQAGKKIEGFKAKLVEAAKFVGEAFAVDAIKEFVQGQVEAATQLERTATRLGLTTEQVEKYNLAAGLSGVSTEAMTTGLRFLSRNMGEAISKGGQAAAAFGALHIKLKEGGKTRDTGDVLEELADRFQAIQDPTKKTQLAIELFGRQGASLIPILNKGSAAFKEAAAAMKELGGPTSKETIESAKKIEEEETKLAFVWANVKTALVTQLFPAFDKLVGWTTTVVKNVLEFTKHTHVLETGLYLLGAVASVKAAMGLGTLLKTFGLLKPGILETIGALWKFAAPAIVVFGLYLIFDDLFTLMKGGRSVIGELLDAIFGLGAGAKFAQELSDEWHRFTSVLETTGDVIGDIATIVVHVLGAAFRHVLGSIEGVGSALSKLAHGDFSGASAAIKEALVPTETDADRADKAAITAAGKDIGKDVSGRRKGAFNEKDPNRDGAPGAWWDHGAGHTSVGPLTVGGKPVHGPKAVSFGHGMHGHVQTPAGLAHAAGTTINHYGGVHTSVHTASEKPKVVRDAASQGVSDAIERQNSNAKTAVSKS